MSNAHADCRILLNVGMCMWHTCATNYKIWFQR